MRIFITPERLDIAGGASLVVGQLHAHAYAAFIKLLPHSTHRLLDAVDEKGCRTGERRAWTS